MKDLYLRPASYEDEELLLIWANDPEVRMNAFHTEMITKEGHKAWFRGVMEDPTVLQFILMSDEKAVGQARINRSGEYAEIDYSISMNFRGLGYGKAILELIKAEVVQSFPEVHFLIGKVKHGNYASEQCFLDSGFSNTYSCFEYELREGLNE